MADATYKLYSDVPHYSMQITVEDLVYTVRLQFNARDGYWYSHLLDETETTTYRRGRRVLPIGEWLTVDDGDVKLYGPREIKRVYDLAGGYFPGMLIATSSRPLQRVQGDADYILLEYVSPETMEAFDAA